MTSVLASQLQGLARQRQPAVPIKKGKASLLFDFQKAADVDLQTIYGIASQGFEELVRLELRFRPYRESLFSRASLDINPAQQTAEFLAKLNESIHGFCCLLSNYFLTPAAFKALEYLVRRYKANERNVNALMMAALPYHSTNEFVRLVQILAIGAPGSLWGWLSKMQSSGASLPRDLLALRCANDRHLLLFVCKAASQLGGTAGAESGGTTGAALRARNSTYLSFYAVLVCEVLAVVPSVNEDLLAALLPHLLEGLGGGAVQDYRAATLIVVAELCSRATLGRDLVKVLLNTMLKNTEPVPEHVRTVLLVMAHLAVTQQHIRTLSDKTLKYLAGLPNVVSELSALTQRGNIRLGPLLVLVTHSLAHSIVTNGGAAAGSIGRRSQSTLLALAHSGVLRSTPAQALAKALLEAGGAAGTNDAVRDSCQQVLRVLDQRYPENTDLAVNAYLEPLRKQRSKAATAGGAADAKKPKAKKHRKAMTDGSKAPASDDDESDDDADGVAESAEAAAAALTPEDRSRFEFVRSTFSSGGYSAPCGGTMMTLAAALAAPQAAVRRMALQQLDADLDAVKPQAGGEDLTAASEAQSALTTTALERLRDDDLGVVLTALGLSCLKKLPPAALLDALRPLSYRLGEYLYGTAKLPQLKAARKAARKVIALLRVVGAASEQLRKPVALLLASFLVPSARDPRVAVEAARAVGAIGAPLFAPLSAIVGDLEAKAKTADGADNAKGDKEASKAKGAKKATHKAAATAIEQAIVSTLSQAVAADSAGGSAEMVDLVAASAAAAAVDNSALPACRRSQHVLLLAAHAAAATAAASASAAGKAGGKAPAAASDSSLLHLVVNISEILLPYTCFTGSAVTWWDDFTAQVSEADGLPTAAHLAALQSDPFDTHAAAILGALHVSLARLPTASDAAVANPSAAVRDLTLLAALGAAPEDLRDLPVLVTTRFVQPKARSSFLAGLYLAPPSADTAPPAALQCLALHVRSQLTEAEPSGGASPASADDNIGTWLVTLLPALGAAEASVRSAACGCLARVAVELDSTSALTGPHLSVKAAEALCKALLDQRQLIVTDLQAVRLLLRSALHPAKAATPKSAATPASAGKKKGPAAAAPTAAAARLELTASDAAQVASYLTASLLSLKADAAGVRTAAVVLSCLEPSSDGANTGDVSADLFVAGSAYLARLLTAMRTDAPPFSEAYAVVLRQLLALYTPATAKAAAAGAQGLNSLSLLAEAAELLSPPSTAPSLTEVMAVARLAAVQRITREFFAALPASGRTVRELFAVLLARYEGDPDEEVRAASRTALESIPLSADLLVPLLDPPSAPATAPAADSAAADAAAAAKPLKKKSKKSEAAPPTPAPATTAAAPIDPPPLDVPALRNAVATLELLQWRTGISAPQRLVFACQSLLRRILPIVGSIASTLQSDDGADEDAAKDAAEAPDTTAAKSSLAGYASTLALQALTSLANQDGAEPGAEESDPRVSSSFDLALAVRTAREAPDAAVRNAALGLLAVLATRMPEAALSHVLQVLAVINQSAALQDDEHSRAVGSIALAAVVPAWVAAGQPPAAVWEQVVSSLPSLPAPRRTDVLLALMKALPQVEEGLAEGLLVLLQHASSPMAGAARPATPAPASATPSKADKRKSKKGTPSKEAEAAAPAPVSGPEAAAGPSPSEYLPELASQLALQVELPVRLAACARVMDLALSTSRQQPQTALPRTVVAFTTAQLKLKSAVAAASASYRRPDPDPSLEAACRRLMQSALAQMQLLQPDAVASVHGSIASPPASNIRRAVLSASRGLYGLFAALQGVMAADTYLQALLALAEHPADKVKRRAIKLFMDKVRGVRAEIEDQIELPQRVRDAKVRQASEAAAKACATLQPLVRSADGAAPLTRQLALIALAAIAAEFGNQKHAALLAAVPAVLDATKDSHASIRASALAAVASFVKALGPRLVPVLPLTVAAAVAAADSAWSRLARAGDGQDKVVDADMQDTAAGGGASGNGDDVDSDDDEASSDDQGSDSGDDGAAARRGRGRGRSKRSDHEDAAVELSSALACLNALVEQLGGFLSPHLQAVLAILLNPRVLACRTAACDKFAASIRGRLPTAVPPRLLLPAFYDRLQPCIDAAADATDPESAAAPATALLQMVAAAASSLEPKLAVQYHEQIFAFLIRALDVRQRRPAVLAAHGEAAIDAVEAAAIRALVALVMKLSEARFKPLFLRMLEWASTPAVPEAGGEPSYLGRMVALFGTINALTNRLRSVMVPYYRYLLDLCVQHLEGDEAGGRGRGKKKQKRVPAGAAARPQDAGQVATWLLRLRVIRALHRCFLYDSVGFVDPERFARLQPVLVAQLDATPPDVAVPYLLSPSHADPDLATYISLGRTTRLYTSPDGSSSSGPLGAAAVGCLLAMAVAANSDALWKPLNHATLMLTRSASVVTRALALEVVAQLVDRLREEYLVLLPESLPFMSELLEDADATVAGRVREVIAQLEEISGEKLDEYLKV